MLRLLTTISFHCMCSLKRTGPLCWTWVTGDSGETCRTRASGRFSCFLVHVLSCWLVGVQGIQASYDGYTALVKSGKVQSYRSTGVWLVQL